MLDRLALPEIAPDGRLREWPEDYEERSQGTGISRTGGGTPPGHRISLQETPELAEAVRKSLDYRLSHDYHAQGWSLGWVACLMARLKQGDRALDLMNHEFLGKTYPNMFVDAHGQVQVGDMMGVPLAMIELLLQSHTGELEVIPALPKQWPAGSVTGLCARGGFVLDLAWADGKLTSASVTSKTAGVCILRYGDRTMRLNAKPGKIYPVKFSERQPPHSEQIDFSLAVQDLGE